MDIVIGKEKPHVTTLALLNTLGFNLVHNPDDDFPYSLSFADKINKSKITKRVINEDFDRTKTIYSFDGINIISVEFKSAVYDPYMIFRPDHTGLKKAIEKSINSSNETKKEDNDNLIKFYNRIEDHMYQIQYIHTIVKKDESALLIQLGHMRKLREENQVDHDAYVKQYHNIWYKLYPEWNNKIITTNNTQ